MKIFDRTRFGFFVLFIVTFFSVVSCSSSSKKNLDPVEESYYQKLQFYTGFQRAYSGFYNQYEVNVALLTTPLQNQQIELRSKYYQWSSALEQTEREKTLQKISSSTEAVISFFSPEREVDDLDSKNSLWRIYLDAGNQRYQGTVKKIKTKGTELRVFYPFHNRFATAYLVTFELPTRSVDDEKVTITLAGPIDQTSFSFPLQERKD